MAGPRDVARDAKLYEQFGPAERHTLLLEALARNDEAEADRLRDTCPRRTYTQSDSGFVDRREVALEIMLVACVDLRSAWAKLHMLQWAVACVRRLGTWQQINSTMALLDGERFGKGRPQMEFFAEREPAPDQEDGQGDAGAEDGEGIDDGQPVEDPGSDDLRMSKRREGELARRMMAVEDRAQLTTERVLLPLVAATAAVAQDLVNLWTAYGQFCRSRLGVAPEVVLRAWEMPLLADVQEALADYPEVQPQPEKVAEYALCCCTAWDRRFGRHEHEDDSDGQ